MSETPEAAPPGYGAGIVILLVVVIGIVGWIAIGSAISLTSFYASFLFLWYWATVDKLDIRKFLPSMIGALIGIALAWGVYALPAQLGEVPGTILALCLILLALYVVIIERVPFAFNPALTLYLTVVAAPALLTTSNFGELALATLLGGAFFALFVTAVTLIVAKLSKPEEVST